MACGPDKELIRLMVQDALASAVKDGTVQGGLQTCDGNPLQPKQKMASCDELGVVKSNAEKDNLILEQTLTQLIADLQAEFLEKLAKAREDAKDAVADVLAAEKADFQITSDSIDKTTQEFVRSIGELTALIATNKGTADEQYSEALRAVDAQGYAIKEAQSQLVKQLEAAIAAKPDTKVATLTVDGSKLVVTNTDGSTATVDLCALPAKQVCEYVATVQVAVEDNCSIKRVAWAYHPDDRRDPAATVELADCNNNTIALLYPTEDTQHNVPVQVDDKVVGYAMAKPTFVRPAVECGCVANPTTPPKLTAPATYETGGVVPPP